MTFEILKKRNFNSRIGDNYISVSTRIISLGGEMAKEINKGDYVLVLMDYENKEIGIKKVDSQDENAYIVSRNNKNINAAPNITNKGLCKMIPQRRYWVEKRGDMWIFKVPEIKKI